jgi:hypothetical protein
MEKCGVYVLKALESKLAYIGSSKNLKVRKSIHFYNIRKKDTKRGVSAIIKAVESGDRVSFEILEYCNNVLEREQYWINHFREYSEFTVVNVFDADRHGSKITDNFRNTMSVIAKERWKNEEYRNKILESSKAHRFTSERLSKEVIQCALDGTIIAHYPSGKKAAEYLGLNNASINAAARGKFRNSHKYNNYLFYYRVLYKQGELLEHPIESFEDNQQPNLSSNTLGGSTTNSRILSNNTEDSNADTSTLPIVIQRDLNSNPLMSVTFKIVDFGEDIV